MNTPQEEAERIARIAGMNHNPDDAVRTTILRETAIAELIAVARAANGLSMGSDWNHGTHAKEHGYRQQLIDALQALSATRKVEL